MPVYLQGADQSFEAFHSLIQLVTRRGVGQSHMGTSRGRGEVLPRSEGYMRLLQGAVTEGLGVEPCGGDIEVDVESAVGQNRNR